MTPVDGVPAPIAGARPGCAPLFVLIVLALLAAAMAHSRTLRHALAGDARLAQLVMAPPPPPLPPVFVKYAFVEQVVCDDSFGTAFRVSGGGFLSVDHVTNATGCEIEESPIRVTHADSRRDFSMLSARSKGPELKINCGGLVPGEWYHAIGYGRGWPKQQIVTLIYRGETLPASGYKILRGNTYVVPGMSGGPVINSRGEVVATINVYNPYEGLSGVRSLSETAACRAH